MQRENIEKIFYSDSREKKLIGRGIYNRASRKGFIRGGIRFPSDHLSAREKKKLNGEVIVSNIYKNIEDVPSIEEIKAMSENDARNVLTITKKLYANKKLCEHFDISSGALYNLYDKVGVVYAKKTKSKNEQKTKPTTKVIREVALTKEVETTSEETWKETCGDLRKEIELLKKEIANRDREKEKNQANFKLEIKGRYSKKEIEDRLISISSVLMEDTKYELEISLEEVMDELIMDLNTMKILK